MLKIVWLEESTIKKLKQIKLDNNLSNMDKVINYLIRLKNI